MSTSYGGKAPSAMDRNFPPAAVFSAPKKKHLPQKPRIHPELVGERGKSKFGRSERHPEKKQAVKFMNVNGHLGVS